MTRWRILKCEGLLLQVKYHDGDIIEHDATEIKEGIQRYRDDNLGANPQIAAVKRRCIAAEAVPPRIRKVAATAADCGVAADINADLASLKERAESLCIGCSDLPAICFNNGDAVNHAAKTCWATTQATLRWAQMRIGEAVLAEERVAPIALQLWDELHGNVDDAATTSSGKDRTSHGGERVNYLERLTREDWHNSLKEMNIGSTSGLSGVTVAHLKACPDAVADYLLLITDCCLGGLFPQSFTTGSTLGIAKDDSRYRPITLLETVHKLVTATVNRRLLVDIHHRNLFWASQFGNVIGGGCATPLRMCVTTYKQARARKSPLHAIFLDFSSAFDTVPHQFLEAAAFRITGQRELSRWIRNMTHGHLRRMTSAYGTDDMSKAVSLNSGTPQGDPISPLIYCMINEIVLRCMQRQHGDGVKVGIATVKSLTFVDDTACFANTFAGLQKAVTNLLHVAHSHG